MHTSWLPYLWMSIADIHCLLPNRRTKRVPRSWNSKGVLKTNFTKEPFVGFFAMKIWHKWKPNASRRRENPGILGLCLGKMPHMFNSYRVLTKLGKIKEFQHHCPAAVTPERIELFNEIISKGAELAVDQEIHEVSYDVGRISEESEDEAEKEEVISVPRGIIHRQATLAPADGYRSPDQSPVKKSRIDLEVRIENLNNMLVSSIRYGEEDLQRMIRYKIEGLEREMKILKNKMS